MIDTKTGEMVVESVRVGPNFTRTEFQSSPLSNASRVLIKNEPFCSFYVGPHEVSDLTFTISLWFYGEKLESIELTYHAKEFGSSWSDWSKERELKRKEVHDQWLVSLLGSVPYDYIWGAISSDYDVKSGSSSIIIRYSWQGIVWQRKRAT